MLHTRLLVLQTRLLVLHARILIADPPVSSFLSLCIGLKARNIVRCSRCPWTKEYRHFENHTKRCDGAQAVPVESSDRSRVGQEPE